VRGQRGISADTALRLQANYDVQCAEDAGGPKIAKFKPPEAMEETERA